MKKNNKNLPTSKKLDLSPFSEAKNKVKEQREKVLNDAISKSFEVLSNVLNDPGKSDEMKIFPAKLVLDAYLFKEKLSREDKKLEIEREKLNIEKAKLSVPGGPLYIIQNVENQQNNTLSVNNSSNKESLKDRKRLQAELLEKVSGIAQFSEIKKDE